MCEPVAQVGKQLDHNVEQTVTAPRGDGRRLGVPRIDAGRDRGPSIIGEFVLRPRAQCIEVRSAVSESDRPSDAVENRRCGRIAIE